MDSFFTQYATYLLQGAALGITAAATPGPFQTFLINQTLVSGWRRSLTLPFAPLLSDPPIILAILFVLKQIPEIFNQVINLAGGTFIFYLVWRLWRDWKNNKKASSILAEKDSYPINDKEKVSMTLRLLGKGALMNLLSPGPYMFWALVSGPILLRGWQDSAFLGIVFLFGFYGTLIIGMLGIVILFNQTRRLGDRIIHSLVLISILILLLFGIFLLLEGLNIF